MDILLPPQPGTTCDACGKACPPDAVFVGQYYAPPDKAWYTSDWTCKHPATHRCGDCMALRDGPDCPVCGCKTAYT